MTIKAGKSLLLLSLGFNACVLFPSDKIKYIMLIKKHYCADGLNEFHIIAEIQPAVLGEHVSGTFCIRLSQFI